MFYPNLEVMIFKRGIKQKAIADSLGLSVRCLYNKIKGNVAFTWPEVCKINKDELFASDTDQKSSA